jgi:serine/threonine protein kinase
MGDILPILLMDTVLLCPKKKKLATYTRKRIPAIEGSFGKLEVYSRSDLSGTRDVIVKRPRYFNLRPDVLYNEALLQKHVYQTLEAGGYSHAVPQICDIFYEGKVVVFSMEYVRGVNCMQYCLEDIEERWPRIVFQVAILLYYLQDKICFDHRDLKYNNIWIRKEPARIEIGQWHIECDFQVILLDFGFACLGTPERKTVVNLGDNVFDMDDKCPKEGRDMFQFIVSFWAEAKFRECCSPLVRDWIAAAVTPHYADLAARVNSFEWVYLLSQQKEFSMAHLEPEVVLQKLLRTWPDIS